MTLQDEIIKALKKHGPLQRGNKGDKHLTLTRILKVPRTTIYDQLEKLRKQGKVIKYPVPNGQGHPPVFWEYVDGSGFLEIMEEIDEMEWMEK